MLTERLHTGGLPIDASIKTDVAAKVGSRTVLIECKRPQNEEGVQKRINEARYQLRHNYQNALRPGYFGVIALDLTKLSNPDFAVLSNISRNEVADVLHRHLVDYYGEHQPLWKQIRERKTAGVVLRVSVLAQFSDDSILTWCQQYGIAFLPGRSRLATQTVQAIGDALAAATKQEGNPWLDRA
jgi:hypothetical protein